MGTILIVVFLLVILAYGIAIFFQHGKEYKDIKFHFTLKEREQLAQQIEAVEIPALACWQKDESETETSASTDISGQIE